MDIGSINSNGLKDLARRSLSEAFERRETDITDSEKQAFGNKLGAFVTIKVAGNLRGCSGRLDTESPLWSKIPELARAAAFEDNRFQSLNKDELDHTDIEITLLGEPVEVKNLDEVLIGRDGLIIERGFNRGLLLPQVAVEHGWDLKEFLAHTCVKAGLEANDWENKDVKILRFEGVVI